jgi:hypothetical protein
MTVYANTQAMVKYSLERLGLHGIATNDFKARLRLHCISVVQCRKLSTSSPAQLEHYGVHVLDGQGELVVLEEVINLESAAREFDQSDSRDSLTGQQKCAPCA